MKVALIKGGGGDTYYELGLLSGLISQGLFVDFIGSDQLKNSEIFKASHLKTILVSSDGKTLGEVLNEIPAGKEYW